MRKPVFRESPFYNNLRSSGGTPSDQPKLAKLAQLKASQSQADDNGCCPKLSLFTAPHFHPFAISMCQRWRNGRYGSGAEGGICARAVEHVQSSSWQRQSPDDHGKALRNANAKLIICKKLPMLKDKSNLSDSLCQY